MWPLPGTARRGCDADAGFGPTGFIRRRAGSTDAGVRERAGDSPTSPGDRLAADHAGVAAAGGLVALFVVLPVGREGRHVAERVRRVTRRRDSVVRARGGHR